MPKVIITAEVQDPVSFEEGFRTHADLFRRQTVSTPINFAILEGNRVACCFEPEDLDTYLDLLNSAETAEAMEFDGVKRETVQVHILDREFHI